HCVYGVLNQDKTYCKEAHITSTAVAVVFFTFNSLCSEPVFLNLFDKQCLEDPLKKNTTNIYKGLDDCSDAGANVLCSVCVFQLEVLQESKMMIPDCQRRLTIAHADLSQILETEEDLAEAEEYKEARTVLDSVKLEG
uniref:Tubulin-specific chaperone A n=1 Tax=Esox lucius TaxID=8010 RepID=A0AAY5LB64_ESOLU